MMISIVILCQLVFSIFIYLFLKMRLGQDTEKDYKKEINLLITAFNRNFEENLFIFEKKMKESENLKQEMSEIIKEIKSFEKIKNIKINKTEKQKLNKVEVNSNLEKYLSNSINVKKIEKEKKLEEKINEFIKVGIGKKEIAKKLDISFEELNFLILKKDLMIK